MHRIDVAYWNRLSGMVSLFLLVTTVSHAKLLNGLRYRFWEGQTLVGLRNHVLDGGTHWCLLANT